MSSDDILEQAARRQQRKQYPNKADDDIILDVSDINLAKENQKNTDNSPRSERPRTSRRRTVSSENQANHSLMFTDLPSQSQLPFIRCKVDDMELKALINTSSPVSIMSMSAVSKCCIMQSLNTCASMSYTLPVKLKGTIEKVQLQIDQAKYSTHIFVADDGPDLIIGMDFLKANNCMLNFQENVFMIGGAGKSQVPFLPEREVPLKYRSGKTPAASM